MIKSKILLILISALFICTVSHNTKCGPSEFCNFTGAYQTNWGLLQLKQSGRSVTGVFSGTYNGLIRGNVTDCTLYYEWKQDNGAGGYGSFTLIDQGHRIRGKWGKGDSSDNGGTWEGNRVKDPEKKNEKSKKDKGHKGIAEEWM